MTLGFNHLKPMRILTDVEINQLGQQMTFSIELNLL